MMKNNGFDPSGFGPFGSCMTGNTNPLQNYFAGLDQAAQGMEPMMKGAARVQLEMITLWSRRAQAYLEIPSRLSMCRTPQDVVNEQMRFWQMAFTQYAEGTRRIMAASQSMMTPPAPAAEPRSKARQRDFLSPPEAPAEPVRRDAPVSSVPRRVA